MGDQVGVTNIVQAGQDEVLDHGSEDAGGRRISTLLKAEPTEHGINWTGG